jgi:hypothetical protein
MGLCSSIENESDNMFMGKAFNDYKVLLSRDDLEKVWNKYDVDSSETMELEEIEKMVQDMLEAVDAKHVKDFKADPRFKKAAASFEVRIGIAKKKYKVHALRLKEDIDTDKDGIIRKKEFVDYVFKIQQTVKEGVLGVIAAGTDGHLMRTHSHYIKEKKQAGVLLEEEKVEKKVDKPAEKNTEEHKAENKTEEKKTEEKRAEEKKADEKELEKPVEKKVEKEPLGKDAQGRVAMTDVLKGAQDVQLRKSATVENKSMDRAMLLGNIKKGGEHLKPTPDTSRFKDAAISDRTKMVGEVRKGVVELKATPYTDHAQPISERNQLMGEIRKGEEREFLQDASHRLSQAEEATERATREAYLAAKANEGKKGGDEKKDSKTNMAQVV